MLSIFRREKREKEEREKREKLEVLLKEYERLSNEMGFHFGIQSQLKYIALFLIGAIATATAALLSSKFFQSVNPSIPIIALLLISFLFTSLRLAYQLQILEFVFIALYIDEVLRPQICKILQIEDTDQVFFSWDRYHERHAFSKGTKYTFLYNIQVYSLYFGTMTLPALVALIIAMIWISVNFSILVSNIISFILLLMFLDMCYITITIICNTYRIEMQKKVKYKS